MGIPDTANTAELLWVAIGLLTGAVNLTLWAIAIRDLMAVYDAKVDGAKRIEGWTWFNAHGLLVLAQCVAIGIGILAALTPPANPEVPMPRVSVLIAAGLIVKQVINCTLGIYLILRRKRLDAYLDDRPLPVAAKRVRARSSEREGGIPDDD